MVRTEDGRGYPLAGKKPLKVRSDNNPTRYCAVAHDETSSLEAGLPNRPKRKIGRPSAPQKGDTVVDRSAVTRATVNGAWLGDYTTVEPARRRACLGEMGGGYEAPWKTEKAGE